VSGPKLDEAVSRFELRQPDNRPLLQDAGISVSMDGRGRWMDNVFIERLWRSLKYECVYLHAFETTSELRAGLTAWVGLYNGRRPHSALGGQTPDEVYGRASSPAAGPACPPAGTQARQRETMKQAA
jgi:putative transposase